MMNMSLSKVSASFVAISLATASLGGCSDKNRAGKYLVTGAVTYNGAPVENGFVTFEPESGKPAEAGPIEDGRYSLYAYPGVNRVSVRAEKAVGFNKGMNQPNMVQYVPAIYNVETELSADIAPNDDNSVDFPLTGEEPGAGSK